MNNKSEKINDMEQMRKIVQGTEFKAIKTRLSYINRLFPQLGPNAECLLFCYIVSYQFLIYFIKLN